MTTRLVTVIDRWSKTLPHFIAHYCEMGITSFQIHVQAPEGEVEWLEAQVSAVIGRFSLNLASVTKNGTSREAWDKALKDADQASDDDWFVIAAQDDFHVFPDPVDEIVARCQTYGYDRVHGCVVDRLGPGGTLPRVSGDLPLWPQFPLGACLTYGVAGMDPRQVVMAKGESRLLGLNEHSTSGRPCPLSLYHVPIHRFRWTDDFGPRLKRFVENGGDDLWLETQRIVDYLDLFGGRARIDDPRIRAARCAPDYQAWDELHRLCLHAETWGILPDTVVAAASGAAAIRANIGGCSTPGLLGLTGGRIYASPKAIDTSTTTEPLPEPIYRSGRTGRFGYVMPGLRPDASYTLRLHFAETECERPSERTFDVWTNGRRWLADFDIVAAAGAPFRATTETTAVRTDRHGRITVDFMPGTSSPAIVSGIELLEETPATIG